MLRYPFLYGRSGLHCSSRTMHRGGGASRFAVNTKKQVEFKKFNLLGGCGGRI